MGNQAGNGTDTPKDRCKVSRGPYPQITSRVGYVTQGTTENIRKHRICRRGKGRFQKRVLDILSQIPKGFTIAVQDESIFVYDAIVRRKLWLPKGVRPVITITGSHQKTCVFGNLTSDGKQLLFRQYDVFNQDTFLDYLKQIKKRLGKVILFTTDRAIQHHRSKKVQEYLDENKDSLMMIYIPKGSPQFNAVEECC